MYDIPTHVLTDGTGACVAYCYDENAAQLVWMQGQSEGIQWDYAPCQDPAHSAAFWLYSTSTGGLLFDALDGAWADRIAALYETGCSREGRYDGLRIEAA